MYIDEFFFERCHIIIIEEITSSTTEQTASAMDNISTSAFDWLQLAISFFALLGGAWCFVQIRKIKEKRIDAMFSFLMRLSVHLKILDSSLKNYKEYILDRLVIPTERNNFDSEDDNSFADNLVDSFLKSCQETLKLLMESDNQVPIQIGWVEKYETLIDFLDTYTKTTDEDFYIWNDNFQKEKTDFYETHKNNMEAMLLEIKTQVTKLEEKISKKHFWSKVKK